MTSAPEPDEFLRDLLQTALAAADPALPIARHLPPPPKGRTVVVGAGKAAAAMAVGLEAVWPGPLSGLVIVPYGYGAATRAIDVVEAAHPVPDAAGQKAARRLLALVQGLSDDDLVLALISGGGSALMALPAPGLTLEDKRSVTQALLRSGAPIQDINCVRKHLSAIKGGRLAAAAFPARLRALMVSDVTGDDPAIIASGPTVADPSTLAEALAVLRRYRLEVPFAVTQLLKQAGNETPKPGDPRLATSDYAIILRPIDMLRAAALRAQARGVTALLLGDQIEGESREVARVMAGIAQSVQCHGAPVGAPCVLLSGGETTVTVTGRGRGGPNGEFILAGALALDGTQGISLLAVDSDGADGALGAAGALALPDLMTRARQQGLDPKLFLASNDAAGFLGPLGALVTTGPTRTNLNDFRAIYVTGG